MLLFDIIYNNIRLLLAAIRKFISVIVSNATYLRQRESLQVYIFL